MKTCEDYLGNIFDSESAMCDYHHVSTAFYNYRRKQGLPLKACLTPYKSAFSAEDGKFDYKGVKYKSLSACCKDLEISYHAVYYKVINKGYSPEDAIDEVLETLNKKRMLNVA